jgi:arginine decarboxylase
MFCGLKKYMLVAGSGEGGTGLTAFDAALLKAGVGNFNLLKVSSILPPGAVEHAVLHIPPGALLPIAYGTINSDLPGEIISAAIAVGVPRLESYGVIMETTGCCPKKELEIKIKAMVEEAFRMRDLPLQEIRLHSVEHRVIHCGSAFAGLVLWY